MTQDIIRFLIQGVLIGGLGIALYNEYLKRRDAESALELEKRRGELDAVAAKIIENEAKYNNAELLLANNPIPPDMLSEIGPLHAATDQHGGAIASVTDLTSGAQVPFTERRPDQVNH